MNDLNMSENHIDKLRDKVNVAVRVRPFLSREQDESEKWIVNKNELRQKQIDEKSGVSSAFAFDHVFDQAVKTSELYNTIVAPIVRDSLKGFNGTILCYGQTSSGKTHTMYGGDLDKGIITLFAEHLFRHIKADSECKEYFIKVGVIEIYNEKLTDLLEPENTIEVRTGKGGSVVPIGLKEVAVNNSSELIDIVRLAHAQRKTRETQMNDQSSRSHTVLRVSIEVANLSNASPEEGEGEPSDALSSALTTSVLHFVDLAGSEKQSQTGSEGDGLKEAGHINKSLSTLSMVINQLSKETQPLEQPEQAVYRTAACTGPRKGVYPPRIAQPTIPQNHVSFRNSKLTRLLESTLRGEAYITMICNVTIANMVETKSTLNFAKTAKNIKVQPKQNFGTSNELKKRIFELQQTVEEKDKEVTRLQKKLDSYQKILPGQHAVQKLKCQLNRSYETASPDKRRHTLCLTTSSNLSSVSTFKLPYTKFPSDDGKFMSTEETALHFQKLTSEREARLSQGLCDKEVQTDAQRFTTPKRTNSAATSCDTPVQTLRLTTSILRDAYETDALEWTDRMSFLEEENKTLRSLEAENKARWEEAIQKIEILNAEKIELENDVLRQMQASKKEMHRRVADSAEYGELQRKLQELSSKIDIITTAAETEKQQLQTELSQRTTHLENIIEEKTSAISKLTKELEEAAEKQSQQEGSESKLEEYSKEIAILQNKLETVTKTAEEEKGAHETKLSEQSRHYKALVEQSTEEISKLTKEREEAEEKCRHLESSRKELERNVAGITTAAEAEKQQLQTELIELSQRTTHIENIIEEKTSEILKLTQELKDAGERYELLECSEAELQETVDVLHNKLNAITKTAEGEKGVLEIKLSEQSMHYKALVEQSTEEISKLTKEREEAEEKCRHLESSRRELEENVAEITTAAETEKQQLQTELSQRTTQLENIIEEKTSEISKLTKELEEAAEKQSQQEGSESKLEEYSKEIAILQNKLETVTKTAEEEKGALETKLSEQSTHYKDIVEQSTEEISKLTKEREEAEEKCRHLESSRRALEENVAEITTTAETEKQQLQTELSQRTTQLENIIDEKTSAIAKLTKELEEAGEKQSQQEGSESKLEEYLKEIAILQNKLETITKTAEEVKGALETKLSEQSTHYKDIVEQSTEEISKLTKELEEAEEKCRHLESSRRALEENVAEITTTAETEKQQLQTELSKRTAQLENIIEEKTSAISKLTKELEEAEEKCRHLESSRRALEENVAEITTAAEAEKQQLQTELSQRTTQLENIIEEKTSAISKLTKELEEATEKQSQQEGSESKLKEYLKEISILQNKLETITKTAEEEKGAHETKLSEQSTHYKALVEQSTEEISKLTKEREEAEEKCRHLESSRRALEENVTEITTTAETEKQQLQTELFQRTAQLENIIEEKTSAISKLTKELEEAAEKQSQQEGSESKLEEYLKEIAILQNKLETITKTAEEVKGALETKLSEQSTHYKDIVEQSTEEISKLTKELEEAEEKCRHLESSRRALEENVAEITTTAEAEKQQLQTELTELSQRITHIENIIEEKTSEISKLTQERKDAEERYELLESREAELQETVDVLHNKLNAISKTAEEDKVILQARLSECTSNFDNIIQQMKSEISKVSKEREEFEGKCHLLESSELKLKESFNQLLTVEKGILEKELQESQAVVTRLEEELKILKETPLPPTPGSSSKQQKIKVNRNVQCDLWKEDEAEYNNMRRAASAYRTRAKKAEGDLEKLGDTIQLLNEKDTRISELEASIVRLEKDIRDLNKIILDSVPVDDGKEFGFAIGIQCDLLDEQIEDAKTREEKRGLLPTSVADILTLRSEVQAAKDKNHHLYSLLRRYESQQEQAAAAGGLLSSSSQSRSNFGIGKPRPTSGSAGPLRMNFGPRISPAPYHFPTSKPKLRTPSQFINQPIVPAQAATQQCDPEEVENVPVHPSTNQISNMESSNQKKKNGDDNAMPSHMNPKRIKIASTPAATLQSKSMAGEVSSSSISHSTNMPPSNLVNSVSSYVGVQPPVTPTPVINLDEDEDSGSEDFMEFLNSQTANTQKQSEPVSVPKAFTPAATLQSKSMAGEVSSSSISHSTNIPPSSLVNSVSSSVGVQPPVTPTPVINLDEDEDSGSEDFMEFLNSQTANTQKQSEPVSMPKASTPPQQAQVFTLEESDEEEEDMIAFYDKLNQAQKEKEQKEKEQNKI